jgi:hypothetical protein
MPTPSDANATRFFSFLERASMVRDQGAVGEDVTSDTATVEPSTASRDESSMFFMPNLRPVSVWGARTASDHG